MRYGLRAGLTFLIGAALFAGLPLTAWGWSAWRGFLADPARAAYLALALLLNLVISCRMPEVGKARERAKTTVARQRWAVVALQLLALSLVLVPPFCDRRALAVLPGAEGLRFAGLALYVGGLLLMHWTQAHLGRQFSVQVAIQDGHRLVTDGPYRRVRHPRYLGILLFSSGLALVFRSALGLAAAVATAAVLLWRIRDEEALMSAEFGPEWEAYARRTRRLLPWVW